MTGDYITIRSDDTHVILECRVGSVVTRAKCVPESAINLATALIEAAEGDRTERVIRPAASPKRHTGILVQVPADMLYPRRLLMDAANVGPPRAAPKSVAAVNAEVTQLRRLIEMPQEE